MAGHHDDQTPNKGSDIRLNVPTGKAGMRFLLSESHAAFDLVQYCLYYCATVSVIAISQLCVNVFSLDNVAMATDSAGYVANGNSVCWCERGNN